MTHLIVLVVVFLLPYVRFQCALSPLELARDYSSVGLLLEYLERR